MQEYINQATSLLINQFNKEIDEFMSNRQGLELVQENPEQFLLGVANTMKRLFNVMIEEKLEKCIEKQLIQIRSRKNEYK